MKKILSLCIIFSFYIIFNIFLTHYKYFLFVEIKAGLKYENSRIVAGLNEIFEKLLIYIEETKSNPFKL